MHIIIFVLLLWKENKRMWSFSCFSNMFLKTALPRPYFGPAYYEDLEITYENEITVAIKVLELGLVVVYMIKPQLHITPI